MHIVAGTFTTRDEARSALHDLEKQGVAPARMNVIEGTDRKGFAREHRTTRTAILQGAAAGAIAGIAIFGFLIWLAGVNPMELRFIALYLCGIALCTAGGAVILAFWNMGTPHGEALLYEEAREKHAVIAAIEVDEAIEEPVKQALLRHHAADVRSGSWQPRGWNHTSPA